MPAPKPKPKRAASAGALAAEAQRSPTRSIPPSSPSTSPSTERSPLLGERPRAPRHRWRPFVLWLLLITLVGAVAIAFSSVGLDDVEGDPQPVQFAEPRVDILDLGDDGIHLNLSMVAGVDVDDAIVKDAKDAWWSNVARRSARTALGLGVRTLAVEVPSISVFAAGGALPLLQISVPDVLHVPVIRRADPLEPFAFEAVARPVAPLSASWEWLQAAWRENNGALVVSIPEARVSLPFARWIRYSAADTVLPFEGRMPALPNLPHPGKPLNLSRLVNIKHYNVSTDDALRISARAAIPNPGLGEDTLRRLDFGVPFAVQLEGVPVSHGVATLAGASRTHLFVGVEGVGANLTGAAEKPLSRFLRRYMKGLPNAVTVQGSAKADVRLPATKPAPAYLAQSLPDVAVNMTFPGPDPAPEIVKSISIEDMSIAQGDGGGMAASGTIVALLVLPAGMEGVRLNVTGVRPDVLVYDGAAGPQDPYDPAHPPARAFSRIATDYFINATTALAADGAVVRAPFKGLPLHVLEGRDGVFQGFLRKVILQRGALAGIDGVADARASLPIGDMQVAGLPVNGSMWIGRSAMLGFGL